MNECRMLRGETARGYLREEAGAARLIAVNLRPRGAYRLYAADTAQCLREGAADDRGAMDITFPARAGGVCLIGQQRAALWTEGVDAVALALRVTDAPPREPEASAARGKPRKRYARMTRRRFPRPDSASAPRPDGAATKKKGAYRLIAARRFPRRRRLRPPSDAPALGLLPPLLWGDAVKWKPYFDYLKPCAPVRDRAWRFVLARAAGGGECYLGMRAEGDAVAEIVALTGEGPGRLSLFLKES